MSLQLEHAPKAQDGPSRWSWRLGAPFGIETRVHASFALVLIYVAWSTWSSGRGSLLVVGLSLAFTLALFGCVLLHELGHALTARRFGIGTLAITLSPIGGVAQLKSMPKTPREELLVAIAGPAVNIAIAGALYGVLQLSALAGPLPTSLAILSHLGALLLYANLALGVFNMIPAFPMDGGRVLRAGLELRMGRVRATEIATNVAKVFAVAFAIYGFFYNVILVLIAGFVWLAGERELRMVRILEELRRQGAEVRFTSAQSGLFTGAFRRPFADSARSGADFGKGERSPQMTDAGQAQRRTQVQVIVDPGTRAP